MPSTYLLWTFGKNSTAGLDKLRTQWRVCMQRACKEAFTCTKLRARKSIKTPSGSTQMLFKVASCSCVWKQVIFSKIKWHLSSLSAEKLLLNKVISSVM